MEFFLLEIMFLWHSGRLESGSPVRKEPLREIAVYSGKELEYHHAQKMQMRGLPSRSLT
jgi:hypothetical protein